MTCTLVSPMERAETMIRSPVRVEDEGGVDADDVQQLVRRLGGGHPAHRVVHHRDGDLVPGRAWRSG